MLLGKLLGKALHLLHLLARDGEGLGLRFLLLILGGTLLFLFLGSRGLRLLFGGLGLCVLLILLRHFLLLLFLGRKLAFPEHPRQTVA